MIASLFLIASQIVFYISVHASNQGTTFSAKFIKLLIALPGALYIAASLFAFEIGSWLELVVSIVLIIEGLYGMH